jgi:hypothetical protein
MKIRLFFGLTALLLIWSCTNNESVLPDFLIGTWKNETSRGIIYESWTKENELELVGLGYSLANGDTTVYETLSIIKEPDAMYYIPRVMDQNEAQPVRFKAKEVTLKKLVFENPSHDFPQVITYRRIAADSIMAEISGSIDGQQRIQRFPMKRVKQK